MLGVWYQGSQRKALPPAIEKLSARVSYLFNKLSLVWKVLFSWQLLSCFSLTILSPPIPPGELLLISWSLTESQLYSCILLCLSTSNPYDHRQRKGAPLSSCLQRVATVELQSIRRRAVRLRPAKRRFSTPRQEKNGKALMCPVFFRGHKTCEHHKKISPGE